MPHNPIIAIPARLGSTRLSRKPLADIHGEPMIVRVWRQAVAANLGPVIVACCGEEIASVIRRVGGVAVITDPDLPSGTDRIHAALKEIDPQNNHKIVVNLQGDLPTIDPGLVQAVLMPLIKNGYDMGTLAAPIQVPGEIENPNVVKIAMTQPDDGVSRALYFSRSAIPANASPFYHHVGVYAYQRAALDKFVKLAPSYLEKTEKLEQLRALEAGMSIGVALIDHIPQSVDTEDDLKAVIRGLLN